MYMLYTWIHLNRQGNERPDHLFLLTFPKGSLDMHGYTGRSPCTVQQLLQVFLKPYIPPLIIMIELYRIDLIYSRIIFNFTEYSLVFFKKSYRPAEISLYSKESTRASQEASMMSVETPTVVQTLWPSVVSTRTRTCAAVASRESMTRTL